MTLEAAMKDDLQEYAPRKFSKKVIWIILISLVLDLFVFGIYFFNTKNNRSSQQQRLSFADIYDRKETQISGEVSCGENMDFSCPEGYGCELVDNYPQSSGRCIKLTGENNENILFLDWKSYSNNKYGYKIQFPGDWTVRHVVAGPSAALDPANSGTVQIIPKIRLPEISFKGLQIKALENPVLPTDSIIVSGIPMKYSKVREGNIYYANVPGTDVYLEITGISDREINDKTGQIIRAIFSTFRFND